MIHITWKWYIYITKNLGVFNYDSYSYLEDLEVQFHWTQWIFQER